MDKISKKTNDKESNKKSLSEEITLEERYDERNNIFDYIRIILSLFVIIAHCYTIFFGTGKVDFITEKILRTESLGGIAVIGFFILSGFMITQSLIHSKNIKHFVIKRLIRIFPSLIIMLFLVILLLGLLVYNGNKIRYFKSPIVWEYFGDNINLFGNTKYSIAGIFINNPYPNVINGSIWTLKHEFMIYIILMIFSICHILKKRKVMMSITVILIFIYISQINLSPILSWANNIGVIAEIDQFIKLSMYFMIGSTIYLYKEKIKMNKKYFFLDCIILLTGIFLNLAKYVLIFTIPYILMYLGTLKIKHNWSEKIGDFSYELYIYAFPTQQLLVYYFKDKINIYLYIFLSIACTSIIGIIMTIIVDNNIKKLKNKIINKI